MTRNLQRQVAFTALAALAILVLYLVATSIRTSYFDFAGDFIAKKYQNAWRFIAADFFVYAGILVGIAMYKGWKKSSLRSIMFNPSRSTLHDIAIWLLRTSFLTEILVYLITFGAMKKLRWQIRDVLNIDSQWLVDIDNIVLQQFLFFVLLDFCFYWMHRIEHRFPVLWAFHKFHHSASEMTVLNSKREHPVESEIFRSLIFAFPFAVLGAPFSSFVIFTIIRRTLSAFIHSGLNWDYGWIGRYLLVSPRYHAIHHSKSPEHLNTNYAGVFPIIDRIFGTYYNGTVDDIEYGVIDDNHNDKNLLRALWVPFAESFEAMVRWIPNSENPANTDDKPQR